MAFIASRGLRIAGKIAGGLLLAFILAVAILHTPPARRYAARQAVAILGRQGVDFNASSLDYNLLSLSTTLRDVTVRSLQAPDLPPLLKADQVSMDLSLRKLIQGKYHIEDAGVMNPVLNIVIDANGRDNIPRPPKSGDSGTSDYFINRFLIRGGTLHFEDRRQKASADVPLDRAEIDGNPVTGNHNIRLTTRLGGSVSLESRTLALGRFSADAELEDDALNVRGAALEAGGSRLTFSGRIDTFQDPRFDVRANSTLALGSLLQFGGVEQRASGTVSVALAAQGPFAQLKATARVDGQDLTLDRFRNVDLKAEAAYDAAASRARLDSINIESNLGTIRGKADLALTRAAGTSTANIAASGVNVATVASLFGQKIRPASIANAQIAARWPGLEFERAAADANVRLTATRASPAPNVIPISGSLNAKTEGARTVVGIKELNALGASANGQVNIANRERLSGQINASAANVGTIVSQVEAFLGRAPGSLVGTAVSGKIDANVALGGTVKRPAAKVAVNAPEVRAGTLDGISVGAAANWNPARVQVDSLQASWRGQSVTASGTVELAGRDPAINVQAQSSQVDIPQVLAGLNRQDLPIAGTASFQANVAGTVKQPEATATVSATNLTAYNEPLGSLDMRGGYSQNVARVDRLRLEKPQPGGNGTLVASGTYKIDTRQYILSAKARSVQLNSLTLPDGSSVRSKDISLDAEGAGSVDDPSLKLNAASSDLRLRDQDYGRLEASANVAAKQAELKGSARQYNLSASARVGTQAPYPGTFELRADNTDLQSLPLPPDTAAQLKGRVTATVRGSGEVNNYTQGQASAQVDAATIEFRGQPLRTDGPLRASYANERLTIDQAAIVAGESRASLTGTLPLTETAGQGTINVKAKLDLASLVPFLPPQQPPLTASGTATIEGVIQGTLRRIDPNLNIALANGTFSTAQMRHPVTAAQLQGAIRNGALELASASATLGPAALTASGVVPFGLLPELPVELPRRQGPAQFTADLKSLDLSTLGALPADTGGTVSAHLEAGAPRPDIAALTALLTLPELRLRTRNYAVEQKEPSRIAIRNGIATIERFQLAGPLTDIRASGTAGLTGDYPLNLRLDGSLDASLASAFSDRISAAGPITLHAAVTGTPSQPQAKGFLELADGQIAIRNPLVAADGINARIELAGTQATLTRLDGSLNGGNLSGSGTIGYRDGQLQNTNLAIKSEDTYFDFPEGLKTISDVELRLRSVPGGAELGGQIVIEEGGFTDDLNLDRGILAAVTAPSSIDLTQERSAFLESLRLNIAVRTANPLVVENNLAKAEVSADLRVLGNPYETGLSGRLEIEENGEIRLQERQYLVERGVITFTNERRIEPELDILATTAASGYDIRLQVQGTPDKTETILTSDPSLPEPDILAILLTGKTLDEIQGQEFAVAREQVLSYLAGRVGTTLGRGIQSATGLSTVRIEPNLIAAETDPSARLTVGQDITRNLELVYSMDLVNSTDQIYVAEYDITKRFVTRGVRQSDGSFRMDFRHDLHFGGQPEPRRDVKRLERRIGQLTLIGTPFFPEKTVLDKFKLDPGDKYDFFKARKGLDRVTKLYTKQNLLEAKVRLQRQPHNGTIDLSLNIQRGPEVQFVFEGITVPGDVQKRVREVWRAGVFDTQRAEDARGVIQDWLVRKDYLQSKIDYSVNLASADSKRVLFDIQPGPRFTDVEIQFEGAVGEKPSSLRSVIKKQELSTEVYTKPTRVTELLTRYYREVGYLDAEVSAPRYELNAANGTGRVVFPVSEGPLYRVGNVNFEGNTVFDDARLEEAVPLPKGEGYRPILRENALRRLKDVYWAEGYNDVDIKFTTERRATAGFVDVTFQIAENQRGVVREILVEGNDKTNESLIRTQLEVEPGAPLSLEKVGLSRRHLYNTGAYSLVDIVNEPISDTPGPDGERAMRLRVRVREIQPFEFRYGAFFDTERGPGVIVDLANRNSLGSARVLGFRGRYDSQLREARAYFSQPLLRRFPVETIVSPFWRQERNPATSDTDPFNVDRIGFSVQQEAKFRSKYLLNYGYRIEKSRTYDPGPDPIFDVPLRIASLTGTISRETRDEILDATRGSFMSHAVQWSPSTLGSELSFIKYFAQYFRYIALQKPRIELFTNEVKRPRLVYAGGVRVGLARGFSGQEVPLSERFFAGGANTIRGFEQNTVGPIAGRTPLGGQAMLVVNNEIRVPLFSVFDGVGFVDTGNVYPKVTDFSFGDLRTAAGAGLRVRTPWFLLRLDYGLKLDRREGESAGRLFFSIGQAF